MGASCSIVGRCRNKETGLLTNKPSALHKALLDLGKIVPSFHRLKANKAFCLSQTDKFLKDYNEELIFDSEAVDSEPVLASFYEAARDVMPEVKTKDIRELLAKKFGEGVYSYDTAYDKMMEFNLQMLGANTFMGTIQHMGDGKYMFRVAYNAVEELNALIQTVANRKAAQLLLDRLEKAGVTAETGRRSLYSTEDPTTIVKGSQELLKLIEVKGGIDNITSFAKETGHFVVSALGEQHVLYKRLWNAVNEYPEIMRALLSDLEYQQYQGTKNQTIELMGHLVGKYLEEMTTHQSNNIFSTFKKLITRAVDYVKTIMPFTNKEYNKAVYEAKYSAYKMAKLFLGHNFLGSLELALSTSETLSGDLNELLSAFNQQVRQYHLLLESTRGVHFKVTKNLKDNYNKLVQTLLHLSNIKPNEQDLLQETKFAQEVMMSFTDMLSSLISNIQDALAHLSLIEMRIEKGEVVSLHDQAAAIKYNEKMYNMAKLLLQEKITIFNHLYVEDYNDPNSDSLLYWNDLNDYFNRLSKLLNYEPVKILSASYDVSGAKIIREYESYASYESIILEARKKIAVRLLTLINGNQFIAVSQYLGIENGKLLRHRAKALNLAQEIISTDICPPGLWLSRWITSLADNPDLINQLVYDVVEQKKHEANKLTLDMKDNLVAKLKELKALGIKNTKIFYEVDDKGNLTGNLISERNWGLWEKNYKEAVKAFNDAMWETFLQNSKGTKAEMFRSNVYLTAFDLFNTKWHEENSVKIPITDHTGAEKHYDDGGVMYMKAPAISTDKDAKSKTLYDSEQYKEFILKHGQEGAEWLNEFINLKKELDEQLPFGATNMSGIRAPLFMGTTVLRISNAIHSDTEGRVKRVFGVPIRKYITHNIMQSPEDMEYGGEKDTYDEPDSNENVSVINDQNHINALNQINRLPMYGVRKLKHMEDLSTDLLSSTLAYASMAYSYGCLDEVVGALEQVVALLSSRKYQSDSKLEDLFPSYSPGSYNRLNDYMMMLVYNIYSIHKMSWKPLRKVLQTLSTFGSFYFLAFKKDSALTNAFTGFNEIVKEALSGEEYNLKDFIFANAIYTSYWIRGFLRNVCNIVTAPGSDIESHNKMDLFLRLFDAQNDNQRKFRDWNVGTAGYGVTRGYSVMNLAMLPYSITDHWMQSMSFLASARHTKLYYVEKDADGNIISKKRSSLWNAYEIKDGKLKLKGEASNWHIKDTNLSLLQSILEHKEKLGKSLTTEERLAIYETDANGLVVDEDGNYIPKGTLVQFDSQQENRFRIRCRGINNRMHGVYNKGDGGAYLSIAIGGPIASLKKYAIGLIDRRFSRARYDRRIGSVRQGSYVTMCNLLWDCFSVYEDEEYTQKPKGVFGNLISRLDRMGYLAGNKKDTATILKSIPLIVGKLLYGFSKFAYLGSTGGWLHRDYLRSRGLSDNQIANIAKCWGDMMMPILLQMLLAVAAPPEEKEKDGGIINDFLINPLRSWLGFDKDDYSSNPDKIHSGFSKMLTNFYLAALDLLPGDKTTDDDYYLKYSNYTKDVASRYGKAPFSFLGILYYQTYRVFMEQVAYNPMWPKGMFNEFTSMLSSGVPFMNALGDCGLLIYLLSEASGLTSKSEEDLERMSKNNPNVWDKYHDGKEIYQKGNYEGWYKWARHMLKQGPLRSMAMWEDGFTAKKSIEYYRGGAGEPVYKLFGLDYDSKSVK